MFEEIGNIRKIEDTGGSAVVLHSFVEEQITPESNELDRHILHGEHYSEALSYFPDLGNYKLKPEQYLDQIRKAKEAMDTPIIGNLNGVSIGGWINYGWKIAETGADGAGSVQPILPPDSDLENLETVPKLVLNSSKELLLRLRWVAILYGQIRADMAITGGVHTAEGVLKSMIAGTNASMMTSVLLKSGIDI